jgi:hypothetical protein
VWISRMAIWYLRNSAKFKGIYKADLFGLKIYFKYMLKSHLQNLLHVYNKKRDDPLVFTETYADERVFTMENDKIVQSF